MGQVFTAGVRPAGLPGARRVYYFYRLREDDFVSEFCVAGADDAPTRDWPDGQYVETLADDGTRQRWAKRFEDGLLVFRPPDGYQGNQGLLWAYDRSRQVGEAAPRELLERLALRERVSVHFGGDR